MTDSHLPPNRQPFMRRLGATGRPWTIALQLAAGAACLLGSFAWATAHLSNLAEPASMTAAMTRLDDMPEIRNGVPDLKRAEPARPPLPEPRPSAQALAGEAPGTQRADGAFPVREQPASVRETNRPEPMALSSAQALEGAVEPSDAEKRADAADPPSAPPVRVSAPIEAPALSAAAVLPKSAPDPEEAQARREGATAPRRELRESQTVPPNAQTRPSAAQRDGGKATRKAEAKPTPRSERKRVASAEPAPAVEEGAAPAPVEAEAKPPESEPVRVLGMALPTGRKIKECLLELRC